MYQQTKITELILKVHRLLCFERENEREIEMCLCIRGDEKIKNNNTYLKRSHIEVTAASFQP